MENKINIAEILKDCPKGMELDCAIWDDVVFESIEPGYYPIRIRIKDDVAGLTEFGEWHYTKNSKCVIFPKGKPTWEGFVPPCKYKNGDIVITTLGSTAIIKEPVCNTEYYAHCVWVCGKLITDDTVGAIRFATESEKADLFKAIKENGYKWNAENKALEELIEPKFKVGDKIKSKENRNYIYTITGIREKENKYECGVTFVLRFSEQDDWELVPNKFNVNNFKPFDKVLMRSSNAREWVATIYSHYSNNKFYGCGMCCDQCIPYKGNEHLLGKTDDCNDFYKTWM